MNELLPQLYLLGLIALLGGASFFVGRQILRVRRDEQALARLGGGVSSDASPQDASGLYELASVQLRKRLHEQAADTLRKALRQADAEKVPAEARALIENAMGFALAAQGKYPNAVRHYRAALRAKADYPVALNNLAFALEKQAKPDEARALYEQVLALEQGNNTARKRLRLLERRSVTPDPGATASRGLGGDKAV
ncbi:MAG: tetratricopeptide repeat protein [Cyanobium sp.]